MQKPSERIRKLALIDSECGNDWLAAQIQAIIKILDEQFEKEQKDEK